MSDANHPDDSPEPVDPGLQRQIDENLKLLYEQVLDKGLPSNLQALVDRLRNEGATS